MPNCDCEKKIILEFILLLKLTDDCACRKYLSKDVWDSIVRGDKITTKLIVENETDDETGREERESERVVVKSWKINLTKAKLNMLAFEDIF